MTMRGGTWDMNNANLLVDGVLTVQPNSTAGSTNHSNFFARGGDLTVGSKIHCQGVWSTGDNDYVPEANFDGGSSTISCIALFIVAGADVVMSSDVTTITGSAGGAAFRLDSQTGYNTYSNGTGTVKFTSASAQNLYSSGQAANDFTQFHDLILEKTSSTLQGLSSVGFHIKVGGDLTITSGILNTTTTTAVDHDLTVTGTTTVGDASHSSEDQATLTCNASIELPSVAPISFL